MTILLNCSGIVDLIYKYGHSSRIVIDCNLQILQIWICGYKI